MDLSNGIGDDIIASNECVDDIFKALHKRNALSVVSKLFNDFLKTLQLKCGENETLISSYSNEIDLPE